MRRLSPYQGTVQIAEMPGFRAMSSDGLTWRVQFLNQRTRISSHAVWRADGSGNLIETTRTSGFIQALQNHPPFPFPPEDNLELWLLDAREHKPLAILASTLGHIHPPRTMDTRWQQATSENTAQAYEAFLKRYSDGQYASEARIALKQCARVEINFSSSLKSRSA